MTFKLTPKVRTCAHAIVALVDITYQQALGGLVMLSEHTGAMTTDHVDTVIAACFGLVEPMPSVRGLLNDHQLLREDEEQACWWEVSFA